MKKTKKAILGSVAAIAMCSSLMLGTTYALFTSESEVNIAVTSANVTVAAKVDTGSVQTKSLDTDWEVGTDGTYQGEVKVNADGDVEFKNVVTGDGVKFDIDVTNTSSIAVKYRTAWECDDAEMLNSLTFKVNNEVCAMGKGMWQNLAVGANPDKLAVEIEMGDVADATVQHSFNITFIVEAVQGNAATEKVLPSEPPYFQDGNCYYLATAGKYKMSVDTEYDKMLNVYYGDTSLDLGEKNLALPQMQFVLDGKKVLIQNGAVTQSDNVVATGQTYPSAVYVWQNSDVEFNNVTINAYEVDPVNKTAMRINSFGEEGSSARVTLSGSTVINGNIELQADPGNTIYLVITDGVTVNGKFTHWGYDGLNVVITGGKFKNEPDAKWVADGYEAVQSDGYWVVQKQA